VYLCTFLVWKLDLLRFKNSLKSRLFKFITKRTVNVVSVYWNAIIKLCSFFFFVKSIFQFCNVTSLPHQPHFSELKPVFLIFKIFLIVLIKHFSFFFCLNLSKLFLFNFVYYVNYKKSKQIITYSIVINLCITNLLSELGFIKVYIYYILFYTCMIGKYYFNYVIS